MRRVAVRGTGTYKRAEIEAERISSITRAMLHTGRSQDNVTGHGKGRARARNGRDMGRAEEGEGGDRRGSEATSWFLYSRESILRLPLIAITMMEEC